MRVAAMLAEDDESPLGLLDEEDLKAWLQRRPPSAVLIGVEYSSISSAIGVSMPIQSKRRAITAAVYGRLLVVLEVSSHLFIHFSSS